ncbi:hypothetical protein ACFC0M_24810 [Streptomyces sp. NPDC056149]|uniref:hypothetical protein n=1 Tax=Streptomyces sp. NPDC056149 TaxID=3345728 RepID=UPI0035E176C5
MHVTSPSAARPRTGRFVSTRLVPLLLCLLTLVGAGCVATFGLAPEERRAREWRAAAPCPTTAAADVRADCLTTLPGVVERLETQQRGEGRARHSVLRLYFRDAEPMDRLDVEFDPGAYYAPGDRTTLTWWRGHLMRITTAQQHTSDLDAVPRPGDLAVGLAFGLLLITGCTIGVLARPRPQRRGQPVGPGHPAEPNGLAFLLPLAATAAWTLPMAGLRPSPPTAELVGAVCTIAVLALILLAWHLSGRARPVAPRPLPDGEDAFLRAYFLDETPYNPHHMGSHIVLGAGPMAVVPHNGPGRLAAKEIPTDRLTVQAIRGPHRDEETVPTDWYVADLLDDGTPVRLTAAPANLLLLIQQLEAQKTG